MQLYEDENFSEVEELSREEILSRIENHVLSFVRMLMSDDFHEFQMIKTDRSNVEETSDSSLIRLGNKRKKRKLSNVGSSSSYARTWKVLSVCFQLVKNSKHVTLRELYYSLIQYFKKQGQLNSCVQDLTCLLQVPRESLGIYASSKGYICGCLEWNTGNGWIDLSKLSSPGLQIPGYFPHNLLVRTTNARYIIVVEKDGVFQRLLEDQFFKTIPCILITACGYPDLSTRRVLKYIHRKLNIPVLGLFDYNPFGVSILMTYKLGSISLGLEAFKYAVPEMKWLGLHSKDVEKLDLLRSSGLEKRDVSMLNSLQNMKFVKQNRKYRKELSKMKYKVEIQALNNISFEFLSKSYLRKKILKKEYM